MTTPSWVVNEKTTMILQVSFFDENGNPVTPSAAWYRLDDVRSNTRLVPSADKDSSPSPSASPTEDPAGMIPFPSLASVVDIEITALQNRMVSQRAGSDERIFSLEFDYDSGRKHGTAEYHYWVKGLAKVL